MDLILTSSLEKIFYDNKTVPESTDSLYLLKGENAYFQIAVYSPAGECKISVEGIEGYNLYYVKEVPVGLAIPEDARRCTVLNDGKSGMYPDLLIPVSNSIKDHNNTCFSVFAEIPCEYLKHDLNSVIITVSDSCEIKHVQINITVSAVNVDNQKLIYTNWFHADCIAEYYGIPVFSEKHWTAIEHFMKSAAKYGMNCILTPLFTPPLDTEIGSERPTVQLVDVFYDGENYKFGFSTLKRYVDLAFSCEIKYIEFSHLFTQWGAKNTPKIIADTRDGKKRIFGWETDASSDEYEKFLSQFGIELKSFTDKEGITDLCFIHCSDEPSEVDFKCYKTASDKIKKYFGSYKHIDALSDTDYYKKGLVDIPVSQINHAEEFLELTDEIWTYYCCGQYNNEVPNRFIAFPSIKLRILGILLYKYNISGFLQWGFNFYFSHLSKKLIDPFKETDACGVFSAGDAFIVYPGENFKPLPSLRQVVFYEGLCDLRVLQTLERMTSRNFVLKVIKNELGDIDFHNYPLDNSALLSFRKKLYFITEKLSKGEEYVL